MKHCFLYFLGTYLCLEAIIIFYIIINEMNVKNMPSFNCKGGNLTI
jgi:hypothetical protein